MEGICNYCFLFCMFLIYNVILISINIYMNLKYEGKKCKKKKVILELRYKVMII